MKKNKLSIIGITLIGTALAWAQDPIAVPLPPPEDVVIERHLADQQANIAAAAERIAEAQEGVRRKVAYAHAGGGGMMGGEFARTLSVGSNLRSSRALVIPKDQSDAKSFTELEEDLGVMAHILDKAVNNGDKTARAMGIAVFGRIPGATGSPQNLFIEGHGAIFLLNVNFPLQPPPAKDEEAPVKEPVNNEWEEARRELERPGKSQTGGSPFALFEERYSADAWDLKQPAAEYDAEKVADLKKDLITALKNAANIRRLKSDETITLVVTGREAGITTKIQKTTSAKPGMAKNEHGVTVTKTLAGERQRVSDAVRLMLRTRKADAEAFQNGKLDFDAFSKKVTVLIY